MSGVYELEEPTLWAGPPDRYSFSSLQAIAACPRKWQLLHSQWGEYDRFPQRPHPRAIEGRIVHEAIERLVLALGKRGLPSIGSAGFQEAVAEVDFWAYFARELDKWNRRLARDPRAGWFHVLRVSPRELANRAVRLLSEQYKPLDADVEAPRESDAGTGPGDLMALLERRGAVSEIALSHPELPFQGILDLVQIHDRDVEIVDFKTGKPKPEHLLQLRLYGVLWWRSVGVVPSRLALQYLDERREFGASEAELLTVEEDLAKSIRDAHRILESSPSEARPNEACRYCAVRARCGEGWRIHQRSLASKRSGTTDVEVVVMAEPSPHGFLAKAGQQNVDIVYDSDVGRRLPEVRIGEQLRVLDVVMHDDGEVVEIRPWSEIYVGFARPDAAGGLAAEV